MTFRSKRLEKTRAALLGVLALLLVAAPAARGFLVHAPAARWLPGRGAEPRDCAAAATPTPDGGSIGIWRSRNYRSATRPASWVSIESRGARGQEAASRAMISMLATPLPDAATEPPGDSSSIPPEKLIYGETTARSFVKALLWRLTAAVVTLISGLMFSGSLSTALSIVGSDFVSKSGFMFAGERVWNKVKWGQGKKGDSAKRSLAKAVLWRIFAASNTLICGIFLAKDLSIASKIAGTDTIFKTALFFVNERVWASINWGKQFEPEYFI